MADFNIEGRVSVETDGVDNVINKVNEATEATKSLKAQLREAKLALEQLKDEEGVDPAKIEAAARKVGQLKDKITEANEQAEIFATGSKFQSLSVAFGQISGDLASMDFEGAREKAAALASVARTITFGEAIKGVKDLGGTFIQLGKSLLANPLFRIVAIIVAIVAAIVKLLDKLGILKMITEAVGKAMAWLEGVFNALIQPLKDLTDWLGWTANAAEDSAQRQADASAKAAEAQNKASAQIIQGLDMQIKLRELEGKSTVDLERQKVQELRKTAAIQSKADRDAYNAAVRKGELDDEEIKKLKEKAYQSRITYQQTANDVVVFEATVRAERKKTEEENTKKEAEEEKERTDASKQAYKDKLAREKEYREQRLAIQRQIEDINLSLMKDGLDKELKEIDIKERRTTEDLKIQLNERKLTQDEYNALLLLSEKRADAERTKVYDAEDKRIDEKEEADKKKIEEDEDKLWTEEKARMEIRAKYIEDDRTREKEQRNIEFQQEQVDLQDKLDNGLITRQEYDEMAKVAHENYREDVAEIDKKYDDAAEAKEKEILQKKLDTYSNLIGIISGLRTEQSGWFNDLLTTGLTAISKFTEIANTQFDSMAEKVGAYVGAIAGAIQGVIGAITESNKQKLEEDLINLQDYTNTQTELLNKQYEDGKISKEQYDAEVAKLDNAAKKKEYEARKKAFEEDKKFKIASAVIAGLQGAVAAFTGAMSLGPIAGPIVGGILAAAVGVMTGININKIKASKFDGEAPGSVGAAPAISDASSASSAPTPPSISLFGSALSGSEGSGNQQMGMRQQTIRAVVVESDITNTQNTLQNYQTRAEVG